MEQILPKGTRVVLIADSYYKSGTVLIVAGALGTATHKNRFYDPGREELNWDYGDITVPQDRYKILHDKAPEEWL